MTSSQFVGNRGSRAAVEKIQPRAIDPFIAVLSGKGGVGKTNFVVNLAVAAMGLRARVLVVDGDLGLANIDVLLGLVPRFDVEDVLDGTCLLEDALIDGPRGVKILPAAAGRTALAALPTRQIEKLMQMLRAASSSFDLVLIDAGAGIGPSVMGLTRACGRALVITNPEPTSIADAYATLKLLILGSPFLPVELVVNGVSGEIQARETHAQIERMTRRFLKSNVPFRGFLSWDERLVEAVARQRSVVELFPTSTLSRQLVELAQGILRDPAAPRREVPAPPSRSAALTKGSSTCTRN